MDLIHSWQQAGVRFSHARNEALELLCEAGVSWRQVDLAGSSLRQADLRQADQTGAILSSVALPDPGGR
jgi:uncharacterized protein YjbI with pentapeptide repeats